MAHAGESLKDLLAEHKDAIAQVLLEVREWLKQQKDAELDQAAADYPLDEINVLKFVLSALRKKSKMLAVAVDNVKNTLEYRKENRDMLKVARATPKLQFYLPGEVGDWLGDMLVVVTYFGQSDLGELARKYGSAEKAAEQGYFVTEQTRLLVDRRTRETGRLCKMLSITDVSGLSLSKSFNRQMYSAMGIVSKHNEINTPQILEKIIVVNAPAMFHTIVTLVRPFMSKATMEKVVLCGKRSGGTEDISACPFVSKYLNGAKAVPECVGGHFKGV